MPRTLREIDRCGHDEQIVRMVLSAEGKGHVMVDVVHDACLGGAPDCFGVQRVDAKVFG